LVDRMPTDALKDQTVKVNCDGKGTTALGGVFTVIATG
jgi:hypothetical protein